MSILFAKFLSDVFWYSQRTVRPQVVTTFNLPGCTDMWTVIGDAITPIDTAADTGAGKVGIWVSPHLCVVDVPFCKVSKVWTS